MPDESRQRIGRYEIVGPLDAGGMGQVYRAWDPSLRREVALKILRDEVAGDPARRHRLMEEARSAGGLNHPNILAVYDVGEDRDVAFIVTELIEGRNLRDEVVRGPLTIKRLLDLGVQMASGLRAAHDAGIAHRDFKPANVMLTRDSRVKIVDFGLAKAFAPSTASASAHEAITVTIPGTVSGTPQYMSPEQARGMDVDFRSDQFAFGLTLYEMATGKHPFRRDSSPQTMAAIIADEAPPLAEINPKVPTVLRWIIERCMAKDPADRYASTTDLLKDLTTLHGRLGEVTGEDLKPVVAPPRRKVMVPLGIGAAALAIGIVGALLLMPRPTTSAKRFNPLVTDGGFQGTPAWSRDSKALAYVSGVDGVLQIFTRNVSSAQPLQITHGGFNASNPFWSPDNSRIYYHSQAEETIGLWSISAAGGRPDLVLTNAKNAVISPDGQTFAFFRETARSQSEFGLERELWLSPANGGEPRRFMQPPFDKTSFVDSVMKFSPDGTKLLVWGWGWYGQQVPTHIPATRFWLIPWPDGTPAQVLPSLTGATPAAVSFDWLPDSRNIVVSLWDPATTGMHLWKADTTSDTSTPVTATVGSENWPNVSADGRRMAFASESIDFDLVDIPLDGGPPRKLVSTSRNESEPAFNRDGTRYAYVSDKGGVLRIWSRNRSDPDVETVIVDPEQFPQGETTLALGSLAMSPDGERVAYQRYSDTGGYRIWISTVRAAGPPVPLSPGLFYEDAPTWSPDGGSIAFVGRNRDYISGLAVMRVGSGTEPTFLLPNIASLGVRPQWSPDGHWIACDTSQGLMIISPDGKEKRVISEEYLLASTWSADSKHIYVLREADKLRHFALTAIDISTGQERVINADLGPIPHASQPIRGLTLSGAGTVSTSIATARSDIWVLEDFASPRTLLDRLLPWR